MQKDVVSATSHFGLLTQYSLRFVNYIEFCFQNPFFYYLYFLPAHDNHYDTGYLVGVCKTTHTAHDTEDVVVQGVDADLGCVRANDRVERDVELQSRLVDTREVARARRLVLLRAQSEGVHVDTCGRCACVVLEGLHLVKVRALALSEAILAVELQLSNLNRVLALAADAGV